MLIEQVLELLADGQLQEVLQRVALTLGAGAASCGSGSHRAERLLPLHPGHESLLEKLAEARGLIALLRHHLHRIQGRQLLLGLERSVG